MNGEGKLESCNIQITGSSYFYKEDSLYQQSGMLWSYIFTEKQELKFKEVNGRITTTPSGASLRRRYTSSAALNLVLPNKYNNSGSNTFI